MGKTRRSWLRLPRLGRSSAKREVIASPVSVIDLPSSSPTSAPKELLRGWKSPPFFAHNTTTEEKQQPKEIVVTSSTPTRSSIDPIQSPHNIDTSNQMDLTSSDTDGVLLEGIVEDHKNFKAPELVQSDTCKNDVVEGNNKENTTAQGPSTELTEDRVNVDTTIMVASKKDVEESNKRNTAESPAELTEDRFNADTPIVDVMIQPSLNQQENQAITETSFSIGQRVVVTSKQDYDKTGVIVHLVRKGTFRIQLGDNTVVNKRWTSLRPSDGDSTVQTVDTVANEAMPIIRSSPPAMIQKPVGRQDDFCVGQQVVITTKDYKDKVGIIVERIKKGTYKVEVAGITVNKRWTSLQPVIKPSIDDTVRVVANEEGSGISKFRVDVGAAEERRENVPLIEPVDNLVNKTNEAAKTSIPTTNFETTQFSNKTKEVAKSAVPTSYSPDTTQLFVGTLVRIVGGSHKNETGRIVGFKGKKTFVVEIPNVGTVNKRDTSIQPVVGGDSAVSSLLALPASLGGEEWRVEDADRGATRFGSRIIEKIRVRKDRKQPKEQCFLTHILGNRCLLVEEPLDEKEGNESFATHFEQDGCKFELVSAKVRNDTDGEGGGYCTPKCVHFTYAKVSGQRLAPIDVEDALLKIGDFASLNPRKVMARLELFQSPASAIFFLRAPDFIIIPDRGNAGCGFIDEYFLINKAVNNGMSKAAAGRLLGIQVRVFIPSMGIFKGMLCRKRIDSGPPVQLCASMLKVGPSKCPDTDDRACLLVTKNGFHSNSSKNGFIGRMLDPEAKPPPKKSFDNELKKKKLSDMILRLWQGLNVPKEVSNDYAKKSLGRQHINHAWVVGLADPTGLFPDGHVFVTGLKKLRTTQKEIFVTRSPCIEPSDGRMLPCVTSKPSAMSEDDWEWLNNLSFGGIIFANPKEGMMSMPERIANGDLDGDLYYVCWNPQILDHIETSPMEDLPADEDSCPSGDTNSNWFADAQKIMTNLVATQEIGALTGKLYTLSNKIADESPLFNSDPDAIAFGEAYKQALDIGKHGGTITLPVHLHEKLPAQLRKRVVAPEAYRGMNDDKTDNAVHAGEKEEAVMEA